MKYRLLILLFGSIYLQPGTLRATHLRAGEIVVEPVDCASLTYRVTVIIYVSDSPTRFGGQDVFLMFGDGTSINIPAQIPTVIDPIRRVGISTFSTEHQFPAIGAYTVSLRHGHRNLGILNIDDSGGAFMYLETNFNVNSKCDASPTFLVPPVDRACSGLVFYHNPGAVDADGDSLSYELIPPKDGAFVQAFGYRSPDDKSFYLGVDYDHANEAGDGRPHIGIDPASGLLSWDAPGSVGEYVIAIKVTEWKWEKASLKWVKAGYVVRDMQIIVETCSNNRPIIDAPEYLCVTAGDTLIFHLKASDPDAHPVLIEAFSDLFSLSNSPAMISPASGLLQSTRVPFDTAHMDFKWIIDCSTVRNQPYAVYFKVTDKPPSSPTLVAFHTVYIIVLGRPPDITNITANPVAKSVKLSWAPYDCSHTRKIQVWKRVASSPYDQLGCEAGIPSSLHYNLLAEVAATRTSITDKDLAIGAQYCYRLIALIGRDETQSKLSEEACIIPLPPEAPVITQVSVDETASKKGSIDLTWTSPFEIDPVQYLPPYAYAVYRSTSHTKAFTKVKDGLADTTFVDQNINTVDSVFRYKIVLYVPALSAAPVDTSSVAGQVRLTASPLPGKIGLAWEAATPWSNDVPAYRYHYILRSENGSNAFQVIDSVDVMEHAFTYVDSGQSDGQSALVDDMLYYYRVLTAGSYGNPDLPAPLLNYSQVVPTTTLDTIPPCAPVVMIDGPDCGGFPCTATIYNNLLSWTDCGIDIDHYEVYASDSIGGNYKRIAGYLTSATFADGNLPERARCYRVAAVDDGDNRALSEPLCTSNCLAFEMPNVFTPGSDGCNDVFLPFGVEVGDGCGVPDPSKCMRSIKNIALSVYDRWGKLLYTTGGNQEHPPLWDGLDKRGVEVSSGVYYYSAQVTFRLSAEAVEEQVYKGWVHLIR